jgi:NAD-dependent SIR2 family protein deacetylase
MDEQSLQKNLQRAAQLIKEADSLIITAGAGMGVDSGLPDFRGKDGFWKEYPALKKAGYDFQEIASPKSFVSDVGRAWGFYGHRLNLYRSTEPHPGHKILKKWGQRMPFGYGVFTSNVDGHFRKAGFDLEKIHECHGSIHYLQCSVPCSDSIWEAEEFIPQIETDTCRLLNTVPTCGRCGSVSRPNILMFYDMQWVEARANLQGKMQLEWLETVQNPVVIEVGAGMAIRTVRSFSEFVASKLNGRLIRINPRDFKISNKLDVSLPVSSLYALREIDACLGERIG